MKKPVSSYFLLALILFPLMVLGCKKSTSPTTEPGTPSGQTTTEGTGQEGAKATGTAGTVQPAEADCTYSTDPKSIKLKWAAYKFTQKTPVDGTFLTTPVKGPTSANSLAALLKGLSMDIDGATIETQNPARNTTIKDHFFSKLNPPFKLEVIVKSLTGSDTQGNLMVEVNMNGVTKEVPFEYTATADGVLTAKGGINLMNWNLKAAFDSIHAACKDLHTGEDGVSKTWDVVDLQIDGKFTKNCK